jgi:hypothetical protein
MTATEATTLMTMMSTTTTQKKEEEEKEKSISTASITSSKVSIATQTELSGGVLEGWPCCGCVGISLHTENGECQAARARKPSTTSGERAASAATSTATAASASATSRLTAPPSLRIYDEDNDAEEITELEIVEDPAGRTPDIKFMRSLSDTEAPPVYSSLKSTPAAVRSRTRSASRSSDPRPRLAASHPAMSTDPRPRQAASHPAVSTDLAVALMRKELTAMGKEAALSLVASLLDFNVLTVDEMIHCVDGQQRYGEEEEDGDVAAGDN